MVIIIGSYGPSRSLRRDGLYELIEIVDAEAYTPEKKKKKKMNELKEQNERVKQRLHYHFGGLDENMIPSELPFLKEFLKELQNLCKLVDLVNSDKIRADK